MDALKSLNTGKLADIFGVTAEHFIYASEALVTVLDRLMNDIFVNGNIPDLMKQGVLTPVFKKKGLQYRLQKLSRNNCNSHNLQIT